MELATGYDLVYCGAGAESNDRYTRLKGTREALIYRLTKGQEVVFSGPVILPPSGGDKNRSPYLIPAGVAVTLADIGNAYSPGVVLVSEPVQRVEMGANEDYFTWAEKQGKLVESAV